MNDFPNTGVGKKDTETIGVDKVLKYKNMHLITNAKVTRLSTDSNDKISDVTYQN